MPFVEGEGYLIKAMNGVGLLSVVRHFLACWSSSQSAFWRFWFAGGGESFGGACIGLFRRWRPVFAKCLPFLPFSSTGVEGPCSPWCFDDLIVVLVIFGL